MKLQWRWSGRDHDVAEIGPAFLSVEHFALCMIQGNRSPALCECGSNENGIRLAVGVAKDEPELSATSMVVVSADNAGAWMITATKGYVPGFGQTLEWGHGTSALTTDSSPVPPGFAHNEGVIAERCTLLVEQ